MILDNKYVELKLCTALYVARSIAWYSVVCVLCQSPVDRNVVFCLKRFNCVT